MQQNTQTTLIGYLSNGGLIKTLGTIILFLFTCGAGTILAYDIMNNQAVSPVIASFLMMVLTHIANMLAQAQTTSLVTSALSPSLPSQASGASNAGASNAAS